MGPQVDPTASGVLRAQFGTYWRAWAWVREQFSATSLTVIIGGIGVLGGWALNLKTRVVVLETQVVPVLNASKAEGTNRADIEDLKARVVRLETNWDNATQHAGDAPTKGRRQ